MTRSLCDGFAMAAIALLAAMPLAGAQTSTDPAPPDVKRLSADHGRAAPTTTEVGADVAKPRPRATSRKRSVARPVGSTNDASAPSQMAKPGDERAPPPPR